MNLATTKKKNINKDKNDFFEELVKLITARQANHQKKIGHK